MKEDWPIWAEVAFRELLSGVREIPGSEHNPRILEYHRATELGASDDETPWCAAFVGWCLRMVFIQGSGRANARSYTAWGDACKAVPGAVTVLWRGKPDGWQGHVGFLVGQENGKVLLLGGNQGDAVSVRSYPSNRVLGYRWPEGGT
jgi:uncharacterized protein (TIGR02594 family)